jgi:hypothetical protein
MARGAGVSSLGRVSRGLVSNHEGNEGDEGHKGLPGSAGVARAGADAPTAFVIFVPW